MSTAAPEESRSPSRPLYNLFFSLYLACTLGLNAVILIPLDATGAPGNNTVFSVSWGILHLLSAIMLVSSRRRDPLLLAVALAFGAFVVTSAFWSVAPADTLIYGVMAAGNIVVAYLFAVRTSLPEICRMVLRILIALTLAGMIAYSVGYEQVLDFDPHGRENFLGGDRIRGFFQHNIMAGLYGAVGLALAMCLYHGIKRLGAMLIFVTFVLMTGSATGLGLMLAAVALVPLAFVMVPRIGLGALPFLAVPVGVVAAALILVSGRPTLELLGRDPTMTGRTVLWEWGVQSILERPILGWGFSAFFRSDIGEVASRYVPEFYDYKIAHYHNSYIQTAVDLGIVGLGLLCVVLIYVAARAYLYARTVDLQIGVALVVTTATFMIASPTEVLFFKYNEFAMFMLFAMFFSLWRWTRETWGVRGPAHAHVLPSSLVFAKGGRFHGH